MEKASPDPSNTEESRSRQSQELRRYVSNAGIVNVKKALETAWEIFGMKALCVYVTRDFKIDSTTTYESVQQLLRPIDEVWRQHIFPIFSNYARNYPDVLEKLVQDAFYLVIHNIFQNIIFLHLASKTSGDQPLPSLVDTQAIAGLFGRVFDAKKRTIDSVLPDGSTFQLRKIKQLGLDGSFADGVADLVSDSATNFLEKVEAVYSHWLQSSSTSGGRREYRVSLVHVSILYTNENVILWKPSNYLVPPGKRSSAAAPRFQLPVSPLLGKDTASSSQTRKRQPRTLPTRKRHKGADDRESAKEVNSRMLEILREYRSNETGGVNHSGGGRSDESINSLNQPYDSDPADDDDAVTGHDRHIPPLEATSVHRIHGGVENADSEKYSDWLSNVFVERMQEKLRYVYIDEWACLSGEDANALEKERKSTQQLTGVAIEAHKMESTVHGDQKGFAAVMAIHNATSEARRESVLAEFNEFPQAQNSGAGSSGKTRFTSYTGPPGTYFMLGSEKTVHLTQKPTPLQDMHFLKITEFIMTEQEKLLEEAGLGYVRTPYVVCQNLFGTPTDVAYQEHNDVYFANTSHDMYESVMHSGIHDSSHNFASGESATAEVRRHVTHGRRVSQEDGPPVQFVHHGSSKFLPTVSETQVTTFCLGENLVEIGSDGNELSDGKGMPKGLVSVKWYNRQHKQAAEIRCGNDTIHIQFYFTQLYFTHKVMCKIKRTHAQQRPPVRLVSSMRPSGSLLVEDHCCSLRDVVTGHEGGISVVTPEHNRTYKGCLDFVRGKGTVRLTDPSQHSASQDLCSIARYMDELGRIGVSMDTGSTGLPGGVEGEHITTYPPDKMAVEKFEEEYGPKHFSLTAGVPAYQFMSHADTVKALHKQGVFVYFDDVPLFSGPVLPGGIEPLHRGDIVSERDIRRYFSLQKNNRRQVTWAKEDTRHVAHIYSEAYKNDEYLLKVGAEIQRMGLSIGDTLTQSDHFAFQNVFYPRGSGGSATRDGVTMPDLRKTGLDDPSGHPPVNQLIRRPRTVVGDTALAEDGDEEEHDLNYVLFAAAGRRAPIHSFSAIGCPDGALVYLGLYEVAAITYATMEQEDADRQFGDWWKNYPGLFSEGDKDYYMFRTRQHLKVEMLHMGLDDGNEKIPDGEMSQLPSNRINIQPGLQRGWMVHDVPCRFTGRSSRYIGFHDFLREWIEQRGYEQYLPDRVGQTLDREKPRYGITIADWLDAVPYFAGAGALRVLGCNVTNNDRGQNRSHPLRGGWEWFDEATEERLIVKKETVERLGYALRASPFPMLSPHADVVAITYINFCRTYLVDFIPEGRRGDMRVLKPSCLLRNNNEPELVRRMGSIVFAAIVNRYTGSGPWFRDYARWERNKDSLLLPTVETSTLFLEYLNRRYAKNQARLSGSLSSQHEKAVANYANKTPAGMKHLVRNLCSKINSGVAFALSVGSSSKDRLSRCFLVMAGVIQGSELTHEFLVSTLILALEECLPPGGRLNKLEWVCCKIAGDICSVLHFPFGEPKECVTGTGGTEGLDLLLTEEKMSAVEKGDKLLACISDRATADPDWAVAVGVEMVEGKAYDAFTGCPLSHVFVDQNTCKLYRWRIFGTASRKISEARQTDREECHPQHDPHNLYSHTTPTLLGVSVRQVQALQRLISNNSIPRLTRFFVEEREVTYWRSKGDYYYDE